MTGLDTSDASVEIRDHPAASRFEVWFADDLAGFLAYRPGERAFNFLHTEVDDRFEGKGLGSRLVRGALDAMRDRHLQVVPTCPFVRSYLARHPNDLDLVEAQVRERFGLSA